MSSNIKICKFENCERKVLAKEFCGTHWAQNHRHGKTWAIYTDEQPIDRFLRNIKINENDCWLWIGAGSGKGYSKNNNSGGYGQLRIRGEQWMSHRWAWEYFKQEKLTTEDTLDHLCRVTRCCNPEHLERLSLSENIRRKNLYHVLISERDRYKQFIEQLGYDPIAILGGG